MSDEIYEGSCYCGAVTVKVSGPPAASAYCHCHSCRKWHAAPVNAWSIWPDDAVDFSGEMIVTDVNDASQRISCTRCGGGVANRKPTVGMTVVYPMTLAGSGAPYQPMGHLFYPERVLDIADGLPKWVDLPKQLGGSGKTVDEPGATGWAG